MYELQNVLLRPVFLVNVLFRDFKGFYHVMFHYTVFAWSRFMLVCLILQVILWLMFR